MTGTLFSESSLFRFLLHRSPRLVGTFASLLLAVSPSRSHAQDSTATIRGRLVGARSDSLSDLPVVLTTRTSGGSSVRSRTVTDSAGRFVFARVPVATYTLAVQLPGRATTTRSVTLLAGEVTDVVLDIGYAVTELATVVVMAARPLHVIGHMPDVEGGVIYSGKKTEVLLMDSLRANVARDVERQILGRVPGAHFSETAGAGFPSNGVGFRGLDPTQSVEVNTRQNGVNIAADVYGYPETYYTPPADALERIEVVRGAGSLAFGPQFGGVVNYVTRHGIANTRPTITTAQTSGSFGFLDSFNALSGGTSAWTYYGFAHFRREDGWRPNSDYRQAAGYASGSYRASDRLTVRAELTVYRNRIHMGGGLSDEEFTRDPSQSFRARNWLASPWNIAAVRALYDVAANVRLETTLSFLSSDRHLIWRNEDGGAAAPDAIDPATGRYVPREVERETFQNGTLESRLRVAHGLFGRPSTLATGVRLLTGRMQRFEGGPGSTNADFDMSLVGGTWERSLRFRSQSAAVFAEELVHVTDRLSVTPGVRFEYLRSTAAGYTDVDSIFAPRTFAYPLLGVGTEYALSGATALYANISEAYRPILYAALTPFGSITRVDRALRTARGYNADFGWRGTAAHAIKFDLGAFYLGYHDRIGTRTVRDSSGGGEFSERSNIGNSVHRGIEAYVELDPFALAGGEEFTRRLGSLDLFTSFACVDARYVSGQYEGNRVEQAPRVVDRTGLTYTRGAVAMTVQASFTSASFGDANNTLRPTEDETAGLVPAYTVLDWSARVRVAPRLTLSGGVNNLANARYFTKRTGEYPGPGILPGIARSVYAGVGATF
ncbi:MAG: TonB-dependent receptor [Gemmatimonadota bacterium]|nr:TonB-dependent receptor [Gemmatimonadota bacterium]